MNRMKLLPMLALALVSSSAAATPREDTCVFLDEVIAENDYLVADCGNCLDALSYFIANPEDDETVIYACNGTPLGNDWATDFLYARVWWLQDNCMATWQRLETLNAYYTELCL